MDKPLSTLTKILLLVWTVVTVPGGLLLLFWPPFANLIVWPAPIEPLPAFHAQLNGALGLGTGIASLLALRQNKWGGAQWLVAMYAAYAIPAEFVSIGAIIAGQAAWTTYFYVVLGLFYLVSTYFIWRQQAQS